SVAGIVASCEGMTLPSTHASSAVVVGAATSLDMGAYLGRLVSVEHYEHGVAVWSSGRWLRRAIAWVDERLTEARLDRTGEPEERSMRPWAAVFRVPASGGPVWLKATGPQARFEVGLYGLLHSVAPD